MTQIHTYVMPEPELKVIDGEFRYTGDIIPVSKKDKITNYLKGAGVYNPKLSTKINLLGKLKGNNLKKNDENIFNFKYISSVKGYQERADEILSLIDRKALEKDLSENGWAVLKGNNIPDHLSRISRRHKKNVKKGIILHTERILQELVYQELSKEMEPVRHVKTEKALELLSDKNYCNMFKNLQEFNFHSNLEIMRYSENTWLKNEVDESSKFYEYHQLFDKPKSIDPLEAINPTTTVESRINRISKKLEYVPEIEFFDVMMPRGSIPVLENFK